MDTVDKFVPHDYSAIGNEALAEEANRRRYEALNLDDFNPGANPVSQADRVEAKIDGLIRIVEKALGADTICDLKPSASATMAIKGTRVETP